MAFNVSNTVGGGGGGRGGAGGGRLRAPPAAAASTIPTWSRDAPAVDPFETPRARAWEPRPINEEQMRNNASIIPVDQRPQVILRFTDAKGLLLSGLLDKGQGIAEHAVVVDAHLGKGNVLLFGNYPIYRGETIGSYPLVFNAIMNYQNLTPTK